MFGKSFGKYFFLSSVLWKIIRPVAIAAAKSTKTDFDDGLVESMDKLMGQDFSDLDEGQS